MALKALIFQHLSLLDMQPGLQMLIHPQSLRLSVFLHIFYLTLAPPIRVPKTPRICLCGQPLSMAKQYICDEGLRLYRGVLP